MPLPLVQQNIDRQTSSLGPAHYGGGIAVEVLRYGLPGIEPLVGFRHLVPLFVTAKEAFWRFVAGYTLKHANTA
jgi:hypothetical protein